MKAWELQLPLSENKVFTKSIKKFKTNTNLLWFIIRNNGLLRTKQSDGKLQSVFRKYKFSLVY